MFCLAPKKLPEAIKIGRFESTVKMGGWYRINEPGNVYQIAREPIAYGCHRWLIICPPPCSLPDLLRKFRGPFDGKETFFSRKLEDLV